MIDRNLWDAAQRVRGTTGACADERPDKTVASWSNAR
jgi:hypothetical protein